MNKMAKGEEYLDLSQRNIRMSGETLECFVGGVSQNKMAGFELAVWTAVRGCYIYKDSWVPSVGEEFVCYQESTHEHDRHTVAV